MDKNIVWLTPRQTHTQYGFSISTLSKWRMNNINLKYSKMGKYIRYKQSDIEEFLERHKVEVL